MLYGTIYTLVSLAALAAGFFAAVAPDRAAKIWGWKNLDQLGPASRRWYFRVYRTWGVLLCLAGILLEAEIGK
jgi:hypothetical protein